MKKIKLFIMSMGIAVISLTLNSCLDNDGYSLGDMWLSVATVESEGNGSAHYFRLDDDATLWPAAGYYLGHNLDDGQRVILNYTILSDSLGGFSHYVKVNDIDPVLTKSIAEDKGDENDEYYGTDPIAVKKVWIGNDYLNVVFSTGYGGNKKHFVNLVNLPDEENPFKFEFRHNAYDDPPTASLTGMVCFDLSGIETEGQTITLTIHMNTYDGEKDFTFEYNSEKPQVSKEKIPAEISSGYLDKIN